MARVWLLGGNRTFEEQMSKRQSCALQKFGALVVANARGQSSVQSCELKIRKGSDNHPNQLHQKDVQHRYRALIGCVF